MQFDGFDVPLPCTPTARLATEPEASSERNKKKTVMQGSLIFQILNFYGRVFRKLILFERILRHEG